MLSTLLKKGERADYSSRDQEAQLAFYVLLWKRKGISLELFYNYWRDVHGPVFARLPAQYQYWQFHLAHNEGGIWPSIGDLVDASSVEENIDGIAELTFKTVEDRETWFNATTIFTDDQHNIFRKLIGYKTSPGNSITFKDGIENGAPNGHQGLEKYHCMIRKAEGVSVEDFRAYYKEQFAPALAKIDRVLKLRLHLFDEVDNTSPDAGEGGVSHSEPPELNYQAAIEIAFWNRLELELFFVSKEYQDLVSEQSKYARQIRPFPERSAYKFVNDGKMTLAGQRSSTVAQLIMDIGAANQLQDDVVALMLTNKFTH